MNDSNLPTHPAIDFFFSSLCRMLLISKTLGLYKPHESLASYRNGSVNFDFTDEESSTHWHFLFENNELTIVPGFLKSAKSTIEVTPDAFCSMLKGDLDYSIAWMTGKVRVVGEANYIFIMASMVMNFQKARNAVGWRGFLRRRFASKILKKMEQINF